MRKISEYLRHAEECRQLAITADTPEHRAILERMAETWLELARARERDMQRMRRMVASRDPVMD